MSNHPSVIARPTESGFEGRDVCNDGHPDTRIPLLLDLYHRVYQHDLDAMTAFLIDAHPAGWSQLGHDPSLDTGWVGTGKRTFAEAVADKGFRCYCHGDRNNEPLLFTEKNTEPAMPADWIYILRTDGIEVIGSDEDAERWLPGHLIPWNTSSC